MYISRQKYSYPQVSVESFWPRGKFFNSGPSLTQATEHRVLRHNTHNHPTSLFFLSNVTQIFYLMNLNVRSFLYLVHFHLSKNYYNGDLKQQPKSVIQTFLKLQTAGLQHGAGLRVCSEVAEEHAATTCIYTLRYTHKYVTPCEYVGPLIKIYKIKKRIQN
jgi:hypothetical protein